MLTDEELEILDGPSIVSMIDDEDAAYNSLIDFRQVFMPEKSDVAPADFHHEWSNILLNGQGHFAIEAFRESAKTQIVIRANLLHALVFPQESRSFLVIICATKDLACKKLQEASRELAVNPMFRLRIGEIIEDKQDSFEVRYKTGEKVRIEAYGKGSSVRGLSWGSRRPDLVIIDDPQDAEDARSDVITKKDWEWFLSDVMFLGRSTRIFLIGNNLGERCIIERVLTNANELHFETRRIPIMQKLKDEHGNDTDEYASAWPAKWPIDEILKDRESFKTLGSEDIWYREKMCQCLAPTSQKFRREFFHYYDFLDTSNMSIYTTVDLAISNKPNADYSAIVTMAVSAEGNWFVLDIDYGHYDPSQTMDAIFGAVQKWRPLAVGIETVAYQAALKHFIEREMPKRNIFFRIEPLRAERRKEIRIDTIQPRFAVGSVWFKNNAIWLPKLESELLAYPYGAHDDIIDALAYMEQLASPPVQVTLNNDWDDMPIAGGM